MFHKNLSPRLTNNHIQTFPYDYCSLKVYDTINDTEERYKIDILYTQQPWILVTSLT